MQTPAAAHRCVRALRTRGSPRAWHRCTSSVTPRFSASRAEYGRSPAPPRTSPPALAGRVISGALSGRALAGPSGMAAGAAAAAAGAFGAYRARTGLTAVTPVPSPLLGLAEDGLTAAAAVLATRDAAAARRGRFARLRARFLG